MKRILQGNVEYTEYDDTPEDVFNSILDWLDDLKEEEVVSVISELFKTNCLNEKGIALYKCMDKVRELRSNAQEVIYIPSEVKDDVRI